MEYPKWNVINPLQKFSLEINRSISKKLCLPICVAGFNLEKNLNISTMMRTAAVMGCSDFLIIGKNRWDARGAVGSQHYIHIEKIPEIPQGFLESMGMIPILIEQGGSPLQTFNFSEIIKSGKKPCFIFGSESEGIPREILTRGYLTLSISQYGIVRSLNVASATSMVIYEYTKQLAQ
jgi:tRNA G18 (ribose-2'-O)-methylase SpoU